jgi:hypothetical protein
LGFCVRGLLRRLRECAEACCGEDCRGGGAKVRLHDGSPGDGRILTKRLLTERRARSQRLILRRFREI